MDVAAIASAAIASVLSGAAAGMVASSKTIAALTVHIEYLKSHIDRHEREIGHIHRRVDGIQRGVDCKFPEVERRNNGLEY